jgi:hypothetical protein
LAAPPAAAKAVLLRFGIPEDVIDGYIAALPHGAWIDAGELEVTDNILNESGFTAV